MKWLKPWDYIPPDPTKTTMADYILGSSVLRDLLNADLNFLSGKMGPQYASPAAYIANMITFAQTLQAPFFFAPSSWNPATAAVVVSMACFQMLAQLPVNAGDPDTLSVYQAWVAGTGQLPGGHAPAPTPTGDGTNAATGQSAAPPNSIL